MDLSRVKTILICFFLCLNLFLGYKLWLNPQSLRQGSMLSREEIALAENLLVENGFELLTTIPKQIPQLALLHVSRPQEDVSFWVNTFFPDSEVAMMPAGRKLAGWRGNEYLEVTEDGRVCYRNVMDPETAELSWAQAERLLRNWDLLTGEIKMDLARTTETGSYFRYVQTYQGFPLFFTYIEVFLAENGAVEVQIDRVTPQGFGDRLVTVVSALSALETFVEEADFTNKKIVDISLGYYSGTYDASRLETAPVWRIAAAGGETFYINAFTGEVEPK
ncbi:MAG TPA: hypothetical protein GX699_04135 [Firmicutes bacterium]|nr:hypothetical protein [Bacillota bacterium]